MSSCCAGGRYDDATVVPEAYKDEFTSYGFCMFSSLSSPSRSSASSPPRRSSRSSCQWRSSAYHTTTPYTVIASSTVVSSSTIAAYALAPPSLGARWLAALIRHSTARSTKLAVCITVRKAERIMFVKATTPAPASCTNATSNATRIAAMALHRTRCTPATCQNKNKNAGFFPPREGLRSQNPVRACILSVLNTACVCMCLCVWQRLYLQSSCAPQESLKKATAERGR
ncbi:hypothetical protein TCDM_12346 [Trypanosoma cruzi Dm28c]|uniref:Uncharacterized protein n=1 Tax=Trypanosoma cruzi Dm28c TaxID=1416333 RepID=V5B3J1_TRYCR|nr:hypothetical protein TCDM_12346 [Trypanosoma cruzi Dm28c]